MDITSNGLRCMSVVARNFHFIPFKNDISPIRAISFAMTINIYVKILYPYPYLPVGYGMQ